MPKKLPKTIDLRPSTSSEPPIGNDPLPGQKPHIWQEFKRDMHMQRPPGEPVFGRGWPFLLAFPLLVGFLTWLEMGGGPEWLIALRSLF